MLPQPPELAVVMRRASFSLASYQNAPTNIMGYRNGGVLINFVEDGKYTVGLHSPGRGLVVIPPFPHPGLEDAHFPNWTRLLSKEQDDGFFDIYVWVCTKDSTESVVHVDMLQNGDIAWRRLLTMATDHLICRRFEPRSMLADDKIYIASAQSDIVVLDLIAKSISTFQLPQGVQYGNINTAFARAEDASGVYLIHAKKLQLYIWFHKGDTWLLVDTICLGAMVANLRTLDFKLEDEPTPPIRINHSGDYAEFVLFDMGRCVLHLDIKCRQLRKVYTMAETD